MGSSDCSRGMAPCRSKPLPPLPCPALPCPWYTPLGCLRPCHISEPFLCENHEFRTKKTWLIFSHFNGCSGSPRGLGCGDSSRLAFLLLHNLRTRFIT